MTSRQPALLLLLLAALSLSLHAHIGSPEIYLDGKAGPYRLFVTIRQPVVIPGVAELEVRSESPGIREVRAVPLPLAGAGAKFSPIADKLKVSAQDRQFFTGSIWMMDYGSWQVRINVNGDQGPGLLAVPVPSVSLSAKKMPLGIAVVLSVLGLFLVTGLVAIVGSGSREAKLEPGLKPSPTDIRRGRLAAVIGAVIVSALIWGGNVWWNGEASTYKERIYKPLLMKSVIQNGVLTLALSEPGWMQPPKVGTISRILFTRRMDDLIPDHDHLMHLYALKQPGLDVVYHLHPELIEANEFRLTLPSMEPGSYKLYADIVHADGFPETLVSSIDVAALAGRQLAGDDASGRAQPWQQLHLDSTAFNLPDGWRMEWIRGSGPLKAKQGLPFRFRLITKDGAAPKDMAFYMGMLGHAAFVKTDGSVFAHVHPNGSVSMAALMLAQQQSPSARVAEMPGMDHSMQVETALPNEVAFPYGFPSPGRYRIFVQMKHGTTVETGIFDATVN